MLFTRRNVMSLMAAGLAAPGWAASAVTLRPQAQTLNVAGRTLPMLAFNGSVPGPELRFRQGDTAHITLDNGLDDGALVHWHGLRVPNRMDGVNVLVQDVVVPGERFDYTLPLRDAGTFWYHSHYLSYEQVSLGLFGAFIVEEPDPPAVDHDITVQLFDMLLGADGQHDDSFDPARFATAGSLGNVKSAFPSRDKVRIGDRVRLRLINPSIDRIYAVDLSGLRGKVVALDGMPLATPRDLQTEVLAPGQRYDVIADVTGPVAIRDTYDGADDILGEISTEGQRPIATSPIPSLPANPVAQPGKSYQTVSLILQGGAGGAEHRGTGTWALNDISGLPRQPLLRARRGETVRIELVNRTAFPHGMHLHGHHFHELDATGELGPLRDTALLNAGETRAVIAVFDNSGRWMLHCHMLSHQADGMATWCEVI